MLSYSFNPHNHVKIWLSNNPKSFMNFENQMRLIEMRELNPDDTFHLIYDSSMLDESARKELDVFCLENNIIAIDADSSHFREQLQTEEEKELYKFYKDEIEHLKEGGNLGVASDILRILGPSYRLGTYTDMDVPVDTRKYVKRELGNKPELLNVEGLEKPLLFNIGSLKLIGKKETVFALNELILVADEEAAKDEIVRIQQGVLEKLRVYSSDYIESLETHLDQNSALNRVLMRSMKNRSESAYIIRATELNGGKKLSSRELRAHINEIMTDSNKYLNFYKKNEEKTNDDVIKRLRSELKGQLGFIKWFFFNREYREIKQLLALTDNMFVEELMKKERSLFLKAIVVCTTGPMELTRSLFGRYIFTSQEIDNIVRPQAFSHYGLDQVFLSRNVIPLHENPLGMLRYLGAEVGVRSDSSWLEEGMSLIGKKNKTLLEAREALVKELPESLWSLKADIDKQIITLKNEQKSFFSFRKARKAQKIAALERIEECFNQETNQLDIIQLKKVLSEIDTPNVFAGFFSKRTQTLITNLDNLVHKAVVFGIAKDKKLTFSTNTARPNVIGSTERMLGAMNGSFDHSLSFACEHTSEQPGSTSVNSSTSWGSEPPSLVPVESSPTVGQEDVYPLSPSFSFGA